MKIVIPGGSGHVGTLLARAFHREGHEVVVLSRGAQAAPWRVVAWDGRNAGEWMREIEDSDVVINLAGRSVNCRYHARHRREIMESRVESTRVVGEAIARAERPPRVWLQASTATIYEHRFDAPNDEKTGILGGTEPGASDRSRGREAVDAPEKRPRSHERGYEDTAPDTWRFSIEVARAWERAAFEAGVWPRTRLVLLRSAIVMSADRGGPFDMLLRLVRLGLGGANGDGRQFVSWIHENDFIRAVKHLIDDSALSGAVNLAAPQPLPNRDFMRALREARGARFGLPATNAMLELGAYFLRTETELILKSRYVVPARLLERGFVFDFADWPAAAGDLCARRREKSAVARTF